MSEPELLRVALLLEFRLTASGALAPFPWSDPGDLPLLLVARAGTEFLPFPRDGLAEGYRAALERFTAEQAFTERAEVAGALGSPSGPAAVTLRHHYLFPQPPPPSEYAGTSRQGDHIVWFDGPEPAAWAWTAREHGRGAEGSVETRRPDIPEALAQRVLAGWVAGVMAHGKLAFFSPRTPDPRAETIASGLSAVEFATSVRYG